MKAKTTDADIMIEVLEEATRRSYSDQPFEFREYGRRELPIVVDLIESGKVRGTTGHVDQGLHVCIEGITLTGRQLRDELVAKRATKRFAARMKRVLLLGIGWAGGMLTTGVKVLIEHFLK